MQCFYDARFWVWHLPGFLSLGCLRPNRTRFAYPVTRGKIGSLFSTNTKCTTCTFHQVSLVLSFSFYVTLLSLCHLPLFQFFSWGCRTVRGISCLPPSLCNMFLLELLKVRATEEVFVWYKACASLFRLIILSLYLCMDISEESLSPLTPIL